MKNIVLNGLLILAIIFWAGCGSADSRIGDDNGAALDENLIAYYPLSEGSGVTLVDHSGNGLNGTISGASWVTGETNSALSFDGVDDSAVVLVTDLLNSVNAITVTAWVKIESTANLRYFITVSNNDWALFQDVSNDIGLAISLPATASASATITTGNWVFIAGTFDGTDIKFYVNGVLEDTTNHPGTLPAGNDLQLGAFGTDYWAGSLDEIRIYNRVLSASEINDVMTQ